ncbi:DoxX family protein [Dongia sp.]|uniref:DoxX family protein n=1 Tax=Dongia sp. TaxID=1977262 RepID=UPI0035B2247B
MTMLMQTDEYSHASNFTRKVRRLYDRLESLPLSLLQLMARVSMATIFWRAGQSKLANWDLTLQLFASEYKVPILPPEFAAPMAAGVELTTPVLLIVGLATRIACLPMIGMTLVIQTFVYPQSWVEHLSWMTFLLLLLTRGPGVVSLDHWVKRIFDHGTK